MIEQEINFKYWNSVDKDTFINNDRHNPARQLVADAVAKFKKSSLTFIEVGTGPGIDLMTYFWPLIKSGKMKYTGYDGSREMIEYVRKHVNARLHEEGKIPNIPSLICGTFDLLEKNSADIVYTKATLEHQPDFRSPLTKLVLAAKKMVIVNWYRPPTNDKEIRYHNPKEDMHYATWKKDDVMAVLNKLKCTVEIVPVKTAPFNELWYIKR